MSSYEIGGVGVGASLIAGPIAVGAAIAILTPIAGGYAVYKAGKAIYDGMVREHEEALERQIQEQARERLRLENAQKVRREIVEECNSKIAELKAGDYWKDATLSLLAQSILSELQTIVAYDEKKDAVNIELQNKLDIQRILDLAEQLKKESALISDNKVENMSMLSFIEKVEFLFSQLSVDEYYFIHNIKVDDEEKVVIRKLLSRVDGLKEKFYKIVAREVERFENCPITSVETNRISAIFEQISNEIKSINYFDSEPWILESKIESIERYIESYNTYKALLDKEQEKFLTLYLCYKESCKKVGEEYKEAVEFDTLKELEAEINNRKEMLERVQKHSDLFELYKQIGREAYICMAFETELNRLNYATSDKATAESVVKEKLNNCRLGDKLIPFYEYGCDSMMQVFKVNDEVGLQLIVHSDGTSTMETIPLKAADEKSIVEAQKTYCEKSKKIEEALKKNWFIDVNLEEKRSANHIALEFSRKAENNETISNYLHEQMNHRRKIAKQRHQRNANKKKERSMALHY